MTFPSPISIQEVAEKIGATIIGAKNIKATGLNEIHKAEKGNIVFVDVQKYYQKTIQSEASIIIINEKINCPEGKTLLICDEPFEAYNKLAWTYRPFRPLMANISETAEIHPTSVIEPNTSIGHEVKIGKNCYIQANVTIAEHCIIGDNVTIQSGTVIGTDAFYYRKNKEKFEKWRSCGRVIIEDNVEIGAACTINKGVSGDTIIGEGTKFDCQVHIGHGVVIGKNCLFAAQVGIGGKTIIGDEVILYGQVGITQRLKIGSKTVVLAQSGVGKDLEGGKTYFGSPVSEVRDRFREISALRKLPELLRDFYRKK